MYYRDKNNIYKYIIYIKYVLYIYICVIPIQQERKHISVTII